MPLDIEQLDQLHHYLIEAGHIDALDDVSFQVLAGGVSSRTVRVDRRLGPSWVLKQSLPKLRVQMDWFSDPMRIHREALGLRFLSALAADHVPQFVFEDQEHHLLAMTAVSMPHENWKAMLLRGHLKRQHVEQFGQLAGTIHRSAWLRRDEIKPLFCDRSHFESLRIEPYYECSATLVPQSQPFLSMLISATRARSHTLVHGDYSPKNVLIADDQLILLDHEVIHFGDPAFDLGFAFTHLLSKGHHLPEQREGFASACKLFWQSYHDTLGTTSWGNDLEQFAVDHTLGCLLARTSGRSPLEYFSPLERERQRQAALSLMDHPPPSIVGLVEEFFALL
jgi:tRNA A-37 threonylcarbamoyl transferase component Bud32